MQAVVQRGEGGAVAGRALRATWVHLLVALIVVRRAVKRECGCAVDADNDVGMGSALLRKTVREWEPEESVDLRIEISESCIQVPTLLSKHTSILFSSSFSVFWCLGSLWNML
ncbi:hypothetical protein C8F04DRAFT_1189334 [Mycena alexandri]|uniref:Uncharacterized protein n=1 Tax=Mycena alexandri TaxID=1745969 RepID=A0AAD6WWV7_9AGAR|nr:hypothetical protein C8F04DRAFT_1189334 [Mycena alexandri]